MTDNLNIENMEFKDDDEDQTEKKCVVSRESSHVHSTRIKVRRRKAILLINFKKIDPLKNETVFDQMNADQKMVVDNSKHNEPNTHCTGCTFDHKVQELPDIVINIEKPTSDTENSEKDEEDFNSHHEAENNTPVKEDPVNIRRNSLEEALNIEMTESNPFLSDDYSSDIDEFPPLRDDRKSASMENLLSRINMDSTEMYENLLEILNHESRHLGLLSCINQYKHVLQESKVPDDVLWNIFRNIDELTEAQKRLVACLENMIIDFESRRHSFNNLMELYLYLHNKCKEYVKNISNGTKELLNLFEKSPKFKDALEIVVHEGSKIRFDVLLSVPTNWLCNSLTLIKRLIRSVDSDNKEIIESTVEKLKDKKILNSDSRGTIDQTKYIRSDLFVELLNPGSGGNEKRKLRHLFLFSGLVICVKRKIHFVSTTNRDDNFISTTTQPISSDNVSPLPASPSSPSSPSSSSLWDVKCDDRFEVKWVIPLHSLFIHPYKFIETNEKRKCEIMTLKERVRNLKMQMISEKKKLTEESLKADSSDIGKSLRRTASNNFPLKKMMVRREIEKLCQHLFKAQSELLLLSPSCLFLLSDSNLQNKPLRHLLVPSIRDIETWKLEIIRAQHDLPSNMSLSTMNDSLGTIENYYDSSSPEIHQLIERYQYYGHINNVATNALTHDDGLNGQLTVNIESVSGLNPEYEYFLEIEIDSFKLTELRARTKTKLGSKVLEWHESFDLELDCSLLMVLLLYQKKPGVNNSEILAGFFKKDIQSNSVRGNLEEFQTEMLGNTNVKFTLNMSCSLVSNDALLRREPSIKKTGLFGKPLSSVIAREAKLQQPNSLLFRDSSSSSRHSNNTGRSSISNSSSTHVIKNVPMILIACLQQIETLGLEEEGIYRISGSKVEIQNLYKKFNNSVTAAIKELPKHDIHTLTGIVKTYLRELPEPLMKPQNYKVLVEIVKESNESTRYARYREVIQSLPEPNKSTFKFLIEHFKKVCAVSSKNQMVAGNIGLILGPTLIMPGDNSNVADYRNIAFETFNSIVLAQIFTQIMNGYVTGQLGNEDNDESSSITNQKTDVNDMLSPHADLDKISETNRNN